MSGLWVFILLNQGEEIVARRENAKVSPGLEGTVDGYDKRCAAVYSRWSSLARATAWVRPCTPSFP
jgi:hypothetical protein